jgi:hypothetical protein
VKTKNIISVSAEKINSAFVAFVVFLARADYFIDSLVWDYHDYSMKGGKK